MKQKIILTILVIGSFFYLISPALAVSVPNNDNLLQKAGNSAGYDVANTNQQSVSTQLGKIIRSALSLVGTIFLILVIYAGILWMTASGNDEQVNQSIGILRSAVIGLAIVASAYSLTGFFLASTLLSASPTSSGSSAPCYLGDWTDKYNAGGAAAGLNKVTYNTVCSVKGTLQVFAGMACGSVDAVTGLVTGGNGTEFAGACSSDWGKK